MAIGKRIQKEEKRREYKVAAERLYQRRKTKRKRR
jgi:hypothetical protein